MVYYVYQLETLEGQIFYIGKGTKKENYNRVDFYNNWKFCKTVNPHLYNKINKLDGKFIINIIEYFEKEKDSLLFEQQLIKNIGLENLCNMTQGGEGWSFNHSKETKQKLSELKKGVPLSKKHCKNIKEGKLKQKNKLNDFYEEIVEHYKTKNTAQISKMYQVHQVTLANFLKKHNIFIPYKNLTPMTEEHKNNISKNKTGKLYKTK